MQSAFEMVQNQHLFIYFKNTCDFIAGDLKNSACRSGALFQLLLFFG